ncbi:hypothetical protein SAMN04488008_103313 [Maribacter orientalis]|uniref:Uncharacterized protein n=1 Tax=Maribacter orientalis TaxID=228957 RepID=A0A1H7NYE1_9FLAO|nr:hypothetical protein SAMN04488008_103313 [Maribacter orientalis]
MNILILTTFAILILLTFGLNQKKFTVQQGKTQLYKSERTKIILPKLEPLFNVLEPSISSTNI